MRFAEVFVDNVARWRAGAPLRYGVVVPDGVKVGGLMTIAYRGPAVIEQEPVACASRP